MRFTVSHRTENKLPLVVLRDSETGVEVAVLPSFGALLHSFSIPKAGAAFNIIDNYHDLEEIKNSQSNTHKSSRLSPFVCRIEQGKYRFKEKDFEFTRKFPDGSAIHGLLFDQVFEVTDEISSDTSASVTLQYRYKHNDGGYPFDYTCLVKYQLKKDAYLFVESAVSNTGKEAMPLADGWHPYFTLGGKTNDWELSFRATQMLEFSEQLIPTGQLLPDTRFTHPKKIGDAFLDNCFLLDVQDKEAACTLRNPENGLQVSFFPGRQYPYLQIYTPPHRNSIAIENLSGAPDCFNNGMGLVVLEPGHSHTFTVGYQLSVS